MTLLGDKRSRETTDFLLEIWPRATTSQPNSESLLGALPSANWLLGVVDVLIKRSREESCSHFLCKGQEKPLRDSTNSQRSGNDPPRLELLEPRTSLCCREAPSNYYIHIYLQSGFACAWSCGSRPAKAMCLSISQRHHLTQ